ncbi:MAG TPA: hypothetical protein VD839_05860 [Burkholderiales bacterium]|nr:hypothetical protein [Burkholderiales bacterium]
MNESLLSPSNIILFGRLFPLEMDRAALPKGLGANQFLRQQLADENAKLARIYAFSYEGKVHTLPKPAVFLVHGDGNQDIKGFAEDLKSAGVTKSGVAVRDFAFEPELRYWEYDKGDFTLRLDLVSGTFDEVLLDAVLTPSSRDALISRSDLSARSDLAARSDLSARSDLAMRHRFKE